jgi:hypothetical protein
MTLTNYIGGRNSCLLTAERIRDRSRLADVLTVGVRSRLHSFIEDLDARLETSTTPRPTTAHVNALAFG